jgi:hypothetical protein
MFVESTVSALSTGVGVVGISKKLFPTFERVFKRIKNGELRIVVLGAGGIGKTTLGKILAGEGALSELPFYNESIEIEQYTLDSNVDGSVIVVPGQERRESTWNDLLKTLPSGKVKLIIHVVAWGHHSFGGGLSYTAQKSYQAGMSKEQFIEAYTSEQQQRELDVLKKLKPHLELASKNKTIMITLVTKQDLWWDRRYQVRDHYEQGEYEQTIQSIRNKIGDAHFTHEYCSASLIMDNFLSGTNEMLIPTTSGYDQRCKSDNFNDFLNKIEKLFKVSLNSREN